MRYLLVLMIALAEYRTEAATHIGLGVDPLPQGCEAFQQDFDATRSDVHFQAVVCKGEVFVWMLEPAPSPAPSLREMSRQGVFPKQRKWIVTAELGLGALPKGFSVLGSFESGCRITGVYPEAVFAVGLWETLEVGGRATKIHAAARYDYQNKRFAAVDPSTVTCAYDEDRD